MLFAPCTTHIQRISHAVHWWYALTSGLTHERKRENEPRWMRDFLQENQNVRNDSRRCSNHYTLPIAIFIFFFVHSFRWLLIFSAQNFPSTIRTTHKMTIWYQNKKVPRRKTKNYGIIDKKNMRWKWKMPLITHFRMMFSWLNCFFYTQLFVVVKMLRIEIPTQCIWVLKGN